MSGEITTWMYVLKVTEATLKTIKEILDYYMEDMQKENIRWHNPS